MGPPSAARVSPGRRQWLARCLQCVRSRHRNAFSRGVIPKMHHFSLSRLIAPLAFAVAIGVAPSAQAETPKDVLVIGHVAELQTLDPAQAVTISDFRILCNMYEGLLHYKDGTLDIEPGLAKSWTISDDGKTYTFKIREGVKYHDGSD